MNQTRIIFISCALFVAFCLNFVGNSPLRGPQINFEKTEHDYGTVKPNSDGTCHFTFRNTGDQPLIISDAKTSCGCTASSWSSKPVMPGKTGRITVRYSTAIRGEFHKTILVKSNAANSPKSVLRISGCVTE